MGAIFGGAVLGILAGLALGSLRKKKKSTATANGVMTVCGPTKAAKWTQSRGISVIALTNTSDLMLALPESRGGEVPDAHLQAAIGGEGAFILVQADCTIYKWQGDIATGNWVVDSFQTEDLRTFSG